MSLLALIATYSGVGVAVWIGCQLVRTVDGGCDGTQFEDRNRPYDWREEGDYR